MNDASLSPEESERLQNAWLMAEGDEETLQAVDDPQAGKIELAAHTVQVTLGEDGFFGLGSSLLDHAVARNHLTGHDKPGLFFAWPRRLILKDGTRIDPNTHHPMKIGDVLEGVLLTEIGLPQDNLEELTEIQ